MAELFHVKITALEGPELTLEVRTMHPDAVLYGDRAFALNLLADVRSHIVETPNPVHEAVGKDLYDRAAIGPWTKKILRRVTATRIAEDKARVTMRVAAMKWIPEVAEVGLGFESAAWGDEALGDVPPPPPRGSMEKLFAAVAGRDAERVSKLLDEGVSVDTLDKAGFSALQRTILLEYEKKEHAKRTKVIETLVAAGANADHVVAKQKRGALALLLLLERDEKRFAQWLIDAGADVNVAAPDTGETALHLAAWILDNKLIQAILAAGADINAADRKGNTPLHAALDPRYEFRAPALRTLLKAKANVDAQNKKGLAPLHIAVGKLKPDALEILRKAGADLTLRDPAGNTALHYAATAKVGAFSDADPAASLLYLREQGLAWDLRNDAGETVLHAAARDGRADVIKMLLAEGADRDAKDNDGNSPVDLAKKASLKKAFA